MDLTPQSLAELSAVAVLIGLVALTILRGIPALSAYIKEKDMRHRDDLMSLIAKQREDLMTLVSHQREDLMNLTAQHRNDMKSLLDSNREERNMLYANIGVKVDNICTTLETIKSATIQKQS